MISLSASHPNFVKNIPFGFRNDIYYYIAPNAGEVLQWLDRETCLFRFEEGYPYFDTGLAYIHFDSSVTSFPFDKSGVLYFYTGVYSYITTIGTSNTIPKFEAVYKIGNLPN